MNAVRVPAGAGCATMVTELNLSSQNHCDYYAANSGDDACTRDAHAEVQGCTGFTGAGVGERIAAAGYDPAGRWGYSEVMAFANDPARAIAMWVNSVWHRVPILSPWMTHFGYGGANRCDTMDFAVGTPMPAETIVRYPYPGQTGVPTEFDGRTEGPQPPAPPTGWPSASPIILYAQDVIITDAQLTEAGSAAPLEHLLILPEDSNLLSDAVILYGHEPFEAQATYDVRLAGTYIGGAFDLEWSFTTE